MSRNEFYVEVSLDDLASFNSELAEKIRKSPGDIAPLFEEAAKEVADEVTKPRSEGNEEVQNIQVCRLLFYKYGIKQDCLNFDKSMYLFC